MKKTILAIAVTGALSVGLVGCGVYSTADRDGKDVKVYKYDGRRVSNADVVVYKRNHRHVFKYDGVRYRVKHHNNNYVYYRI